MNKFKCGHDKIPENVRRHKVKGKLRDECRICHRERAKLRMRDIRRDDPEKLRNRKKQRYHSRPEIRERYSRESRKRRYGQIGVQHFETQMKEQKGLCAICRKPLLHPQQDHDHKCCRPIGNREERKRRKSWSCGKCLRGLLCSSCNMRLVDLVWLKAAQQYLLKWKRIHCKGRR